MPWTESRSREEWLAEVQRRGGLIRRRRRVRFGVVGALALVLPVSVTATVLRSAPERAVELSVAGPKPAGEVPGATSTVPIQAGGGGVGSAGSSTEQASPPAGAPSPTTTTTEVHRRVASANGSVEDPTPPSSVPPEGAPAIAGAEPPAGRSSSLASSAAPNSALEAPPGSTGPPITRLRPCAASEVKATVTMDQTVYTQGQAVSGSSTLENISGSDCHLELVDSEGRVISKAFFRIEDAAGGAEWFQSIEMSNCGCEQRDGKWVLVPVEPERTISHRFAYEPSECAESCPVVASAGRYSVVVEWMSPSDYDTKVRDSGRYIARGSFQYGMGA